MLFLDDGIAAKGTAQQAKRAAKVIEGDLKMAGFHINHKKSDFTPKQEGRWLGVVINTKTMAFYMPREKYKK